MAKIIIGIHGLKNKPPKQLLEQWWKQAIEEGLKRDGYPEKAFVFKMVYWADLVYGEPESPEITDPESPYFLDEPYLPSGSVKELKKDNTLRKKVLLFVENQIEKVFLNEDLSLNHKDISDNIIHRYFRELELYYSENEEQITLKANTRARLSHLLERYKYDDILLIGHSMGSIIAYDVLQYELKNQQVDTFVTIGSPLGFPIIRAKIAEEQKKRHNNLKIKTPESIEKAWINFADLEDKVALNYNLSRDFEASERGIKVQDFEIVNDYIANGEKNPHKSYGYLRSPGLSKAIHAFLSEKEKFSIATVTRSIMRFFNQLKYSLKKD